MSANEQQAAMKLCVLAALADGTQTDAERAQIQSIVERFTAPGLDLAAAYQDILAGKVSSLQLTNSLTTPETRTAAHEMAVCICNSDGALNDAERRFLANLRQELQLESTPSSSFETQAAAVQAASAPAAISQAPPSDDTASRQMILNYAILSGALELIPQSLATMAIIPLQMRMVYRVGKRHGHELGTGHIKDLLATVGVGLTSQVLDNFLERLVGRVTRKIAGGWIGALAGQAASSGMTFATTYAIGHVADRYYASGRTLSASQLRETFSSLLGEGQSLGSRHAADVANRARNVRVTDLLPLIRGQ